MKRFEMRDMLYFGLYSVAFVLLLLNALHAGKERKAYREQMDAIELKIDALASSTDALGTRFDTLEQGLASDTDAINEIVQTVEDVQKQMQEELKKVNDKIKEVEEAKALKRQQEAEAAEAAMQAASASYVADGGYNHPFMSQGRANDGTWNYTWYSQRVLPGGGLDIPGRHVTEDGFVRDADGNICVASDDLDQGAEIETPYGKGKVYDTGSGSGNLDLYTDW